MEEELKKIKSDLEIFKSKFEDDADYPEDNINSVIQDLNEAIKHAQDFDWQDHNFYVAEQNEIDAYNFRNGI